jgi:hypothetical protein
LSSAEPPKKIRNVRTLKARLIDAISIDPGRPQVLRGPHVSTRFDL